MNSYMTHILIIALIKLGLFYAMITPVIIFILYLARKHQK